MTKNWSNPKYVISLIVILGIIALGIVSILRDKIVSPIQNQLSVTAQGKVFAKPDIASLSFGVRTAAKPEAVEAAKEGTEQMNKVTEALKKAGVEEKDMQTTQYSLLPTYNVPAEGRASTIAGYELNQSLIVKVRDLDKIGDVIKAASSAGANQIGNISFTIDDKDELKAEARKQAIDKAKSKAEQIEKDADIKLGKIINIYENDYNYNQGYPVYADTMAYCKGGMGGGSEIAAVAPEIQTGQNEVLIDVTLVYQVK